MTTRTYITKSGDQYEWEETTQVLAALKVLHQPKSENQQHSVPTGGTD